MCECVVTLEMPDLEQQRDPPLEYVLLWMKLGFGFVVDQPGSHCCPSFDTSILGCVRLCGLKGTDQSYQYVSVQLQLQAIRRISAF